MQTVLNNQQEAFRNQCRSFVDQEIIPYAGEYDRDEILPETIVKKLAINGYLCSMLPKEYGGQSHNNISIGILNEEFGRGCASTRSLLTVHGMVGLAIERWGTIEQRKHWLSKMTSGEIICSFALTEPNAGSDSKSICTTAENIDDSYVINGVKQWITMGQIANMFLVFAQVDNQPSAFLVSRSTPGVSVKPIKGMLGSRASMLAEIHFENCVIPKNNLIGKIGTGITHIALLCLDYGRYTIASGCVGSAQACLESSVQYASNREQFGKPIKDNQLIRKMITEMSVNIEAARMMCLRAGELRDEIEPEAIIATWQAKYFASTILQKIVSDAVQIHGANGCTPKFTVERHYRDSKINEIIEGSTQIHETLIAEQVCNKFSK